MKVYITCTIDVDSTSVDSMSDMDHAVMQEFILAVKLANNADEFYHMLDMTWKTAPEVAQENNDFSVLDEIKGVEIDGC